MNQTSSYEHHKTYNMLKNNHEKLQFIVNENLPNFPDYNPNFDLIRTAFFQRALLNSL
jgi:hypothetical protein